MHERTAFSGLEALGFFRFILATSVAAFHLWNPAFPDAGRHAVAGFFCISGFLITMIANESYNDRPWAFLLNRFLRIFPTYWICISIALVAVVLFPVSSKNPFVGPPLPTDIGGWINNLLIFSLASGGGAKMIPQSWSLEVELYFYLIIGLCTYRSFALTMGCLAFASAYALLLFLNSRPRRSTGRPMARRTYFSQVRRRTF